MVDTSADTSVELYVRSLAPNAAVQSQVERNERLQSLFDADAFESCTMHVVGRGIVHDTEYELSSTARLLQRRIGEVRAWADRHDASIPGIRTFRVEESPMQETCYTVTTVPQNFMLEFEEDSLRRCSPAVWEGTRFSVDDHFEALESMAESGGTPGETQESESTVPGPATAADSNP